MIELGIDDSHSIGALSSNEPADGGARPPVYAYIQEGGSSLEMYLHTFETLNDAQAGRVDCALGSYRTSPVLQIDRGLADHPAFGEFAADLLRVLAVGDFEYVEPSASDDDACIEKPQAPGG